jgi:hypothetical protein
MTTEKWPRQSECDVFYGHIAAIEPQLTAIASRFTLYYEHRPIRSVRIHPKCSKSLSMILYTIYTKYHDICHQDKQTFEAHEAVIAAALAHDGVSNYSGTYANRAMRGSNHPSMHAYGCAIDFDAEHNARGTKGRFTTDSIIVREFEAQGWIWGGRWKGDSCDPMHFQAARVG